MASFTRRVMAAIRAFREAYITSGMAGFSRVGVGTAYDFETYEGRATRYEILWAYYQGNAYRNIYKWANKMKSEYKLYTYIRDIYNPGNRICNFHQTRLWGGPLDMAAGDGSEVTSALPIMNAEESMRSAISQLWKWSRFGVYKDIITLYGSIFGDVFVRITDDPDKEVVFFERIHPGWITDIRKDPLGAITSYEMQYSRLDPLKNDGTQAVYTEIAILDSDAVTYQTFRDGAPFAWDDSGVDEWTLPFPFIPMIHIQHNNVGLDWGWGELFPNLSKFRELDDQASKLSDQIRKMVDSPWLFSGVRPGKSGGNITITGLGDQNPTNQEIGREETPILYAHDPGARAYPLVSELDIAAALESVKELSGEIERSYPELRTTLGARQRDVSGRALLLARQEAEDKVAQRRVNYDSELERLHRMAVAIGGDAKYEGFIGFSLDKWDSEATDHDIDPKRPVFKPHPSETLDQDRALWTNASLAERVGVGLDEFLRDQQWDEARIADIINSDFYKMHLLLVAAQLNVVQDVAASGGSPSGQDGDDEGGSGDLSGRGTPTVPTDFDVSTLKQREG
jgi:hypothetical protein